jgi:hypothetical protein
MRSAGRGCIDIGNERSVRYISRTAVGWNRRLLQFLLIRLSKLVLITIENQRFLVQEVA